MLPLGTVPEEGEELVDSGEREIGQLVRVQSSHTTDSLHELWLKPHSQASHQPVFDRLQYAKMEGEGLGNLVMCTVMRCNVCR